MTQTSTLNPKLPSEAESECGKTNERVLASCFKMPLPALPVGHAPQQTVRAGVCCSYACSHPGRSTKGNTVTPIPARPKLTTQVAADKLKVLTVADSAA